MRSITPIRVLVVAHQTAAEAPLLAAVSRRANEGPCTFTLLVPRRARGLHRVVDPEDHGTDDARARITAAVPLLSAAAGDVVVPIIGDHDPLAAIEDALNLQGFDEIIISMLPARVSRWLRIDLPRKARALGLPVTEVIGSVQDLTDVPAA
jgi:hypothetical protein